MSLRLRAFFGGGGGFVFVKNITGTVGGYNLRADAIAAGWDGVAPLFANITIAPGAVVYGGHSSQYAFATGNGFPAGSILILINNGSILGFGGNPGSPGYGGNPGTPGENGFDAIQAQHSIEVTNNGLIGGGGGGGGAGGTALVESVEAGEQRLIEGRGGAGGFGAGRGGNSQSIGADGTYATRGGVWVMGGKGGDGGPPGKSGFQGGSHTSNTSVVMQQPATSGGHAGNAIVGGEFVRWIKFGDVRGGTVYGTNSVIPTPAPTPAIGAVFLGGYYANTLWQMTAQVSGAVKPMTVGDKISLHVENLATRPLFYVGQRVRVAPKSPSANEYADCVVLGANSSTVSLDVIQGSLQNINDNDTIFILGTYRIIVAGKEGETVSRVSDTSSASIPAGAVTVVNGNVATSDLSLSGNSPAADWCKSLSLGGFSDWYLGSRDEIELIYRAFKPVAINNYAGNDRALSLLSYATMGRPDSRGTQTGLNMSLNTPAPQNSSYVAGGTPTLTPVASFRQGGGNAAEFGNATYLSSSKFSDTEVWAQLFHTATPGRQVPVDKTTQGYIRAIRRDVI